MHRFFRFSLFILFLTFSVFNVFGGGPMLGDDVGKSGEPPRWAYDSSTGKYVVKWFSDPGPLTSVGRVQIDHAKAINEWVLPLFDIWKNVKLKSSDGTSVGTVALDFKYMGKVNDPNSGLDSKYKVSDIDETNYQDFVGSQDIVNPPPTVVIFDADGSIIKNYYFRSYKDSGFSDADAEKKAKAAQNGVVGLSSPYLDSQTKTVTHGMVILNGRLVNGNPISEEDNELSTNSVEAKKRFQAMILHEIGHMLNLDHTQVNLEIAESCELEPPCEQGNQIPTLYPALKSTDQIILHQDDKATISWLYPNQAFKEKFCTIVGEIQNAQGKGMQGVNVIARNVADPIVDARSMVSGVLFPAGTEDGHFYLSGIVPGKDYEVIYEELSPKYNAEASSSFAPLGVDSPKDFGTGTISGPDGASSVRCGNGGETISMPAIQLLQEGQSPGGSPPPPEGGAAAQKKGWWCSLRPNSEQVDFNSIFPYISIYVAAIFILICRFFVWCFSKRPK